MNGDFSFFPIVFYLIAAITVVSAAGVAFSNNIVYSAFALMGTLMGAAGLFVMLAADFVAVVQVLIYVGGILVLTLFAVMLTHRIADVRVSNRSLGRLPSLVVVGVVGVVMSRAIAATTWHAAATKDAVPTTYGIGDAFLGEYILPFELASMVLLAALVGAVVLSRKELKAEGE
jgi:NADH-quinone oxidoreductase subunit J